MNDFLAQSGLQAAARSAFADLILGLFAGLLALTGAGFLLLTGFFALTPELGPTGAAGLIGAGLFSLAALAWLILRSRHLRPVAKPLPPPVSEPVADPAVMAVFVLGFVLARRMLRQR